jgi:hypothetical protein
MKVDLFPLRRCGIKRAIGHDTRERRRNPFQYARGAMMELRKMSNINVPLATSFRNNFADSLIQTLQ